MRRIESGNSSEASRRRLVIIFRGVGKSIQSRSCTLILDEGEPKPNLDQMLERAVNAIVGGSREHS